MSKAIVERCPSCQGHHSVQKTERCWDCRGTGKKFEKVEEKCRDCYGTGRFVKKLKKKPGQKRRDHSVVTCRRCRGTGKHLKWVPSEETCGTCNGSGKFKKRVTCRTCKGKGRTTINSMGLFMPANMEKKLHLTGTS